MNSNLQKFGDSDATMDILGATSATALSAIPLSAIPLSTPHAHAAGWLAEP
jgi:hypothetical protein